MDNMQRALRDIQALVGPRGSLKRLQAGGVEISPGNGILVSKLGVPKTRIEPDGDLFVGWDVEDPAGLSLAVFSNDQAYNTEEMGRGDILIGDNSATESNVKYDASEGQWQFRYGQTVKVYMDTDGSIKAGAGVVTLSSDGISIALGNNAANKIKWGNVLTIYGVGNSAYVYGGDSTDSTQGGNLTLGSASHSTQAASTVVSAGRATGNGPFIQLLDQVGAEGDIFLGGDSSDVDVRIGAMFVYDEGLDAVQIGSAGTHGEIADFRGANIVFNEAGADRDIRFEGDTDSNLTVWDAGLDAVGIGTAAVSGFKLAVAGDTQVSGGFLNFGSAVTKTIAGGVITATQTRTAVDTEGAAATDDLDTINGGTAGDIIILSAADSTHDVVCKDGTGNLSLEGDFTLDNGADKLVLMYSGSVWTEISRANNA